MKVVIPKFEREHVARVIAEPIARLKADPTLLDTFIARAVKLGADRLVFPSKLHRVMNAGFPPSAFILALLIEFQNEHPDPAKKKKRG